MSQHFLLSAAARSLSLARLVTPFVAGLYRAGASYLYVNRGAGSVMPMVRLSRIGRLCGVLTVTLGKKA